jgi:SAM-dependent methyltransferase
MERKPDVLSAAGIEEVTSPAQRGGNAFKNFWKRWPRLYEVSVFLIGPSFFTGLNSQRFIDSYAQGTHVLQAGSGTHRLKRCSYVSVDLLPLPEVGVLADLTDLPFSVGVFDAVTCDQVLEHIPEPERVAREFMRVVRPGGLVHIASPFVFPWHPSPLDYTRWTLQGQASIFPGCTVVEQGVMAGPCSALTALLSAFFATVLCCGSKTAQEVLQYVFLVLFAPLKFLDVVIAHIPGAELCSANFYTVVRVPKR